MHAILALSHAHRRYLLGQSATLQHEEDQLVSSALASYNARLSSPVTADDCDALLATATLINAISFAASQATSSRSSWPLVSSPTDLQWLAVQPGPKLILNKSANWLQQSVFLSALSDFEIDSTSSPLPTSTDDPSELLPALSSYCGISTYSESNCDDNVYAQYIELLTPMLSISATTANMAKLLPFVSAIQGPFLELLRAKETRALLLLSWWYALICPLQQWWLAARARMECAAICVFLEEEADAGLLRLLEFPAIRCKHNIHRSLLNHLGRA